MDKIKLYDIVNAVGGSYGLPADMYIDNISTDTRTITEGSLFIALVGEKFDGHDFAKKAIEQGAVACVVEKQVDGVRNCIMVDSTSKALLDLAAFYRRLLPAKTVGVTGSVGKTTTKEMISLVLSKKYKTYKTIGNLNNQIGVPKTLFSMDSSYEVGVIEMGMNHIGEISTLSTAAIPDIAAITNIGFSHIENLGSRENILKAKLEILDGAKYDAPLVINIDDDMLKTLADKQSSRRLITYSCVNKKSDVYAKNISSDENSCGFDIVCGDKSYKARLNIPGRHNIANALCAFCIGDYLGVSHEAMIEAISEYHPEGMRQNISVKNGVRIILDCYNAAPDSMKSALSILMSAKTEGKTIACLSDMLELGSFSKKLHKLVGEYCAEAAPDVLVCIGEEASNIADVAKEKVKECVSFATKEEANIYLNKIISSGDTVLFKGSRGMKLEELVENIEILK